VCVFCVVQSTGTEARLIAETDSNTEAVISTDAESNSASQLDAVSLSAGKEFINPRGIRFTTASSHRLDGLFYSFPLFRCTGWCAYVKIELIICLNAIMTEI